MKKTRYSESQIVKVLKEVEAGRSAKDVCREYGILAREHFTTGVPNMVACKPPMLNVLKS